MLPSGINFEEKEKMEFDPLPEDVYQVQLLDVEMQSKPSYDDKTVMENVLSFQFVVVDDGEFRGRSIWKNFVPTYLYNGKKGKNGLYQITEAIIRRELKDEDKQNLSSDFVNDLVGYQCRVTVKNKTTGEGKTFSNIDTFLPAKSNVTPLTEDEKQKATPKKKQDEKVAEFTNALGKKEEEIPTINLDDEPADSSKVPF